MLPSDPEAEPYFTRPLRQIVLMVIVLGLVGVVVMLALPTVLPIFEANPYLNGFILLVFVVGVIACFWQVIQIFGSVSWIKEFAATRQNKGHVPTILAPLATLLRSHAGDMRIAASSGRSILDSVATRIDEDREITRYIVNLLIFLGLLGTFYGLATTVPALVETIRSLSPAEGEDGVKVFERLMSGLDSQLSGMGVAFGSSLLGLAGSLAVGLLELFAGHSQNRFYRELEEWLSSITRLGVSTGEEGASDHITGVLDRFVEETAGLRRALARSDLSRASTDAHLAQIAGALAQLSRDGTEREDDAPLNTVLDAESRMRLRSMDTQLARIAQALERNRPGRDERGD